MDNIKIEFTRYKDGQLIGEIFVNQRSMVMDCQSNVDDENIVCAIGNFLGRNSIEKCVKQAEISYEFCERVSVVPFEEKITAGLEEKVWEGLRKFAMFLRNTYGGDCVIADDEGYTYYIKAEDIRKKVAE